MAKVTKNLSLDEHAVARGERYSKRHQTNLSRVVSDFLARLPLEEDGQADLAPAVSRLFGIAASENASIDREDYRAHLIAKYGSAPRRKRR
jgi:Family of unknown function (DUF6364)